MFRPSTSLIIYWMVVSAVVFFSLGLWPKPATQVYAQSIADKLTSNQQEPWRITADSIDYNSESTTYHANGNVIIERPGARLVADSVAFNSKAMTASAIGHILMTVGDDVMTGSRIDLNLDSETGEIYNGGVFLKKSHFYIKGDHIEKTGKDTYRAKNGTITACDGERPDWVLKGKTVKVTVEGYGTATHAVFKVRNLPILYTPYIFFPVKTKRQTGLLLPEAGKSDRKGVSLEQPLFWAINENTDATLYTYYMEKRGTKIGLEYRYAADLQSNGTIMADGMLDRRIDDGTPDNTLNWGYAGDAYDRPNKDRYWLRAKIDQQLPWNAMAKLDFDLVSDQDYLTEFREGRSGFYETRDTFLKVFGRDIDTYDESIRTNRLNINRTWSQYSLNGDILWNDNITNRRWEDTDDTLQKLPLIEFDGAKQSLFDSNFFWNLNSEYAHLFTLDSDRGHRTDIYPRIYLPFKWKRYLAVEPSAGWRQTAWIMDRQEDQTLNHSNYRQVLDAKLDLSTEFSTVIGSHVGVVDRIQHSVKPRVIYNYVPNQDQSDLPDFGTNIDRIEEANKFTYSLTNNFTARKKQSGRSTRPFNKDTTLPIKESMQNHSPVDNASTEPFKYDRFCRLYLEQSYDIAAADEDDIEPFSDIYGELDMNFGRYVTIDSDAAFNIYENHFSSHNVATGLTDHRGDRLWVEHRYKKLESESIYGTISIKLTDRLTARGKYERNLLDDIDISKGAGFLYTAQCWSFDFFYAVEGEDKKFLFFINLMGIGGFGQ